MSEEKSHTVPINWVIDREVNDEMKAFSKHLGIAVKILAPMFLRASVGMEGEDSRQKWQMSELKKWRRDRKRD